MEGEVSEPGAWMPEQVMNPPHFFSHLAKHGLTVELHSPIKSMEAADVRHAPP